MGCGQSNEGQKGGKDTYKEPKKEEQLGGKTKYVGDSGAVVMQVDEKKGGSAGALTIICFVDADGDSNFVLYQQKTGNVFLTRMDDAAFTKKKEDSGITFTFTAIFKSIATELVKSKAKHNIRGDVAGIEFTISSVKDAKATFKLSLDLQLVAPPKQSDTLKYVVTPLTCAVQKRRLSGEDKEKEMKTCKLSNQGVVIEASIAKNRATVERISPHLVPLREESAAFSKVSGELVAKIASTERKIRKMHAGKAKNFLDGVYEDGGARCFQHCPDAEEHVPQTKESVDHEKVLDYLGAKYSQSKMNDDAAVMAKAWKELQALQDQPDAKVPDSEKVLDTLGKFATPKMKQDPALMVQAVTDPELQALHDGCPPAMLQDVLKLFTRVDEWDMCVFDLETATGGNALLTVAYTMLHKMNLVHRLNIDDKKLRGFLRTVQSGYHPNPYHNSTHAADVAQINYFILTKGGLIDKCKLSQEEIFGALLAGVVHDYDHPGFNNNFHTRTNAYLSTLYNDRSILENHHLACVFEMMRLPKYNLFTGWKDEAYREVRDTMTEMVLSTDMGLHGKIFGNFRRRLGDGGEWNERKDDVRLALSMSIKMADISNCGRPKHLYLKWAESIATEFYNQGDVEQKACIPISPFMDRRKDKQEFPKGQISFMNFIVVPMFEAISEFLPPVECSLQCCTENKEYWQQQE